MSSPREAVYDVLITQRQRAQHAEDTDHAQAWDEYEAANQLANSAYRPSGRIGRPAATS